LNYEIEEKIKNQSIFCKNEKFKNIKRKKLFIKAIIFNGNAVDKLGFSFKNKLIIFTFNYYCIQNIYSKRL